MIDLAWPQLLLALPAPWLLARWLPRASERGAALFLPLAADLGEAGVDRAAGARRLSRWLLALSWLLLVLAAARPQWLGEPEPVPTTGRRLMLAIDVSGSMEAEDMAGRYNRLQVVQKVAGDFIRGRPGDQFGLIVFGSQAYLQAPLTADIDAVIQFLNEADVGIAGRETAVGDAIGLAIKRLRDAELGSGDTVMILLTDGRSNTGVIPPLEAARLAAAQGLRIYTIGVGSTRGEGLLGLLQAGADLDEDSLKEIARITGGEYFRATDARALQQVYQQIDRLEPSAGRERWYRPRSERYVWPLGLALLFSVVAVLLGERNR